MRAHCYDLRILAVAAMVITATAVSGCFATAAVPAPAISVPLQPLKQVDVKPICVAVKTYTPAEELALGVALAALDEDSPIIPAMGDYKRMRDQARACANAAQ